MNEKEKKAIEYYQNKEVSLSVNFDTENLLKALGITEEDSFENHQIRFKTLLNLIEKLQKENEELNGIYQLAFKDGKESYIRKVKDRIEKYKKLSDKFYAKFLESDRYNTDIREKGIKCDAIILALEELIEEREEKEE